MHVRVFVLTFLVFGGALKAAPPELGGAAARAYGTVKAATTFSSTHVGAAGLTPEVIGAFRTLLGDAKADAAFKSLLEEATPVGQLYALCGLWYTDPAAFRDAAEKLKKRGTEVPTLQGCMMSKEKMSAIIESKESGAVRLKSNKESVKDWMASHKGTRMYFDIIGGAWPSEFKDDGGFPSPVR